jgi:hypothetical protein
MKLSSTAHSWAPQPFRVQIQICTDTVEAVRTREKLMALLALAGHLTEKGEIKRDSQRNEAAKLVHWLATNLDQSDKPEVTL